jgi:prepilin-type N-terminal cleavage/methylation domain-containing protein
MTQAKKSRRNGFTLVELLIAMAVFMIIGGAAVKLVRAHIPLVSSSQNQAGLNMALRSVAAQMQLDAVNAGYGYSEVSPANTWNLGIVVKNNVTTTDCHNATTFVYSANCFDSFSVVANDPTTAVGSPTDTSGSIGVGGHCTNTATNATYLVPPGGVTAATLAGQYAVGDQILLVKAGGAFVTTFTVIAPGASVFTTASGENIVKIPHNPTNTDGTTASDADDPIGIARHMIGDPSKLPLTGKSTDPFSLGTAFCTTDYAYKLNAVNYYVDATTDPTNPKLMRSQGGTFSVVAEQIIGFKVGASIKNSASDNPYSYDSNSTDPTQSYYNDWSTIRALRVSVIGRTPPGSDVNDKFQNGFDNGPYRVEAVSVVINPRNLSMND